MASQDNEVESEKDKTVGQAGTVEDSVKDAQTTPVDEPAVEHDAPADEKGSDDSFKPSDNDELAKWKAMSRKNEDRASANYKAFQSADAELKAAKYAAYNPIDTSKVERKPQQTEDALARKVAMQAEFPSGTSHPKRQPGDAYKRVMERQKARKRSK